MQTVCPGTHSVLQAPLTHASPMLHALPHAPQLAGSTVVLMQLCPHWVVPPPQLVAHMPCEQTLAAASGAQTVPQAPQLAGSSEVTTHVEPHIVWPVGHDAAPSLVVPSVVLSEELASLPVPPPVELLLPLQPATTTPIARSAATSVVSARGQVRPTRLHGAFMIFLPRLRAV